MNSQYMEWLNRIPKNQVSQIVGKLVDLKMPHAMAKMAVSAFAQVYNINVNEAEKPIDQYSTVGEFFTRKLKPGARPIQSDLIHPCDGAITESGFAADGILIQAKGITYSVESLLGDWDLAERLHGGVFSTYYLCPTDYHRVHFPVSGRVIKSIYIPGTLWPVNQWSVKHVRQLFAINERLVTVIESDQYGLMALVMVGATNVGKMTVSYDSNIVTNAGMASSSLAKQYQNNLRFNAGDELGIFHMGSTVICVFEADRIKIDPRKLNGPVKMGQSFIP